MWLRGSSCARRLVPHVKQMSTVATIDQESTRLAFADIIGDESLRGKWMSQGPILERMDMIGAAIACKATQGGCATVSFDQVESHVPVYHGDLFQLEGQILNINNTSTSIHLSGYRVDMLTGTTTHTHDAILTFVAVDKDGRPRSGLPRLVSPSNPYFVSLMAKKAAQRKELGARWRTIQEEVDKLPYVSKDMLVVNPLDATRTTFVPVKATLVEVQNLFLPKHLNMNNTIFGGEILQWMDKVAVFCARKFTKNVHMATISMNRIVFQLPITTNDVVSMKARVVMARYELGLSCIKLSHMRTVATRWRWKWKCSSSASASRRSASRTRLTSL
ncbi:hypothetical protein, variant [Aphanomyces invadans]|uniref:HotDog ACOT-type domain-containing protein n=1 Tax=Aphanomyces invadans TaxID=157072 RepID=A0A024UNK3_9STRA|nr:hypothetical protein, variant [Aphanomyces invadans]ETW07874.1 hypothetical protein, variant [Aphanomyces invadans]|eukprot:XP_008863967.1 hypothetical protein, variant [Aphanomyces invadans]